MRLKLKIRTWCPGVFETWNGSHRVMWTVTWLWKFMKLKWFKMCCFCCPLRLRNVGSFANGKRRPNWGLSWNCCLEVFCVVTKVTGSTRAVCLHLRYVYTCGVSTRAVCQHVRYAYTCGMPTRAVCLHVRYVFTSGMSTRAVCLMYLL